jgi:hypothetical protein
VFKRVLATGSFLVQLRTSFWYNVGTINLDIGAYFETHTTSKEAEHA